MSVKKYLKILLGTSIIVLGIIITIFGIADLKEYNTGNNFFRNFFGLSRKEYGYLKIFIYFFTGILLTLNGIFNIIKRIKVIGIIDYETEDIPNFIYHKSPLKTKHLY